MKTAYDNMSDFELEVLLANIQNRLDDKEDERSLILEQAQSGQHISSKYIQSHCEKIDREMESLENTAREIKNEMENRKVK
jgi:hypothetical protein